MNMKTAAGIREKADALRELLELGQNGGGPEALAKSCVHVASHGAVSPSGSPV